MLDSIGATKWREWQAMFKLMPWGPERDDMRALYSGHTSLLPWQKGGGKIELGEYFPHLAGKRKQQTDDEHQVFLGKLWVMALGGEVTDGEHRDAGGEAGGERPGAVERPVERGCAGGGVPEQAQ